VPSIQARTPSPRSLLPPFTTSQKKSASSRAMALGLHPHSSQAEKPSRPAPYPRPTLGLSTRTSEKPSGTPMGAFHQAPRRFSTARQTPNDSKKIPQKIGPKRVRRFPEAIQKTTQGNWDSKAAHLPVLLEQRPLLPPVKRTASRLKGTPSDSPMGGDFKKNLARSPPAAPINPRPPTNPGKTAMSRFQSNPSAPVLPDKPKTPSTPCSLIPVGTRRPRFRSFKRRKN